MSVLRNLRASLVPLVALAFVYGCGSSDSDDAAGSSSATSTGASGNAGTGGASGAGAAAGTAGDAGYWGGKCTTAFQCPVPAVACASGFGSPYAATCIDGTCGVEMVPCPQGTGGAGGGGAAGTGGTPGSAGTGGTPGSAGTGGTPGSAGTSGGGGGKNCDIWGCCQVVSDCKLGPAVGPNCWNGEGPGSMGCEQGLCTWKPYTCPPPLPGTAIDQLDAACGECAKTMTGAPAGMPTVDCATVDAGCGAGGKDCYKSLHCVQKTAQANGETASNDCAVNACGAWFQEQKPAKNLYACLADKCGTACKLTPGYTTTVCK